MANGSDIPVMAFGFPGPLRDKLVAAIRNGSKTSTTSTLIEYSVESEAIPQVGQRHIVIDSDGKPAAEIEITAVTHARLTDIDVKHARDEGEGFESVDEWRRAHEQFWHGDAMRAYLDDPQFIVNDCTELVLERFRLVRLLP